LIFNERFRKPPQLNHIHTWRHQGFLLPHPPYLEPVFARTEFPTGQQSPAGLDHWLEPPCEGYSATLESVLLVLEEEGEQRLVSSSKTG